MAIAGVELQVMKQLDRLAEIKSQFKGVFNDSETMWALVDGAADETYENRVKGSDISAIDAATKGGNIGTHLRQYFSLHDQYATRDLLLSGGFLAMLLAWGWPVHEYLGDAYYEAMSRRMTAGLVFPSPKAVNWATGAALNRLALITAPATISAYAALDTTKFTDTPLIISRPSGTQTGNFQFDIKLRTINAETAGNEVTLSNVVVADTLAAVDYDDESKFIVLGETTPSDDPGVGDTSLHLTAVAGFKANGYLLIREKLGGGTFWTCQLIRIKSDWNGSSPVTFATGTTLRHDFTGAALVAPCFREVKEITVDSGTLSTGTLDIRPLEMRVITKNI